MKYRNILLFFGISTPICLLLRTLQIVFVINDRGFMREGYSGVGLLIEILIFAALGVTALLSFLSHRRPAQPPRVNLPLGISAIVLGVITVLDLLSMSDLPVLPGWQRGLMTVCGLAAGLALIIYGASGVFRYNAPPAIMVAPIVFWVVRLIRTFTMLNTLAMTAGHLLLLVTYCVDLLFMLQLGKLMNGLEEEANFRKLMASGLCAVSCGLIGTVPHWIAGMAGVTETTNETGTAVWLIFFQTVFAAVFVFSHFSEKNLSPAVMCADAEDGVTEDEPEELPSQESFEKASEEGEEIALPENCEDITEGTDLPEISGETEENIPAEASDLPEDAGFPGSDGEEEPSEDAVLSDEPQEQE